VKRPGPVTEADIDAALKQHDADSAPSRTYLRARLALLNLKAYESQQREEKQQQKGRKP
jgi:hypothetical protein